MDAELGVDVGHVGLHGVVAHAQLTLDIGTVAALGEQGEDLGLARSEAGRVDKAGNGGVEVGGGLMLDDLGACRERLYRRVVAEPLMPNRANAARQSTTAPVTAVLAIRLPAMAA